MVVVVNCGVVAVVVDVVVVAVVVVFVVVIVVVVMYPRRILCHGDKIGEKRKVLAIPRIPMYLLRGNDKTISNTCIQKDRQKDRQTER